VNKDKYKTLPLDLRGKFILEILNLSA